MKRLGILGGLLLLLVVPQAAGRAAVVDASGTISGSNPYIFTVTATGTEPDNCMGLQFSTDVNLVMVSGGPAGFAVRLFRPFAFGGVGLHLQPGASTTFQFTTAQPLPSNVQADLNVGGENNCMPQKDVLISGITPPPPPPPPPPPMPEPNPAPHCGAGVLKQIAYWWSLHGKRSLSAKPPGPSPLQGQCTLPPRGPCKGVKGALIDGGPTDDNLVGTPAGDEMNGHEGNDSIDGKDDNDLIRGGPGRDTLLGGPCDDVLFATDVDAVADGGPGQDVLNVRAAVADGGPDDDYIVNGFPRRGKTSGGGGNDLIVVTGEEGTVSGGPGNDTIYAVNRSPDTIDCGPGTDTLYADKVDKFKGCEHVTLK